MPTVTVVPSDSLIIVDGAALVFTYVAPENLHALQWRGDTGHTEWTDGPNKLLIAEDYDEQVAPYVKLWQAEKARPGEDYRRISHEEIWRRKPPRRLPPVRSPMPSPPSKARSRTATTLLWRPP